MLDHDVQPGNPADAPLLAPSIARVTAPTQQTPRTVTANRGYGEQIVDGALTDLGVGRVVIPRRGRPSKPDKPKNDNAPSAAT